MRRPSRGSPRSFGKNSNKGRMKLDSSYWIYRVMKEMGWTVDELKACPIPTFKMIIHWISKEDEQGANSMK
jgi:hypothetical protein